jgi:hypothetical protein
MINLKAMPRFQPKQIKTTVQKTKRTTQKPKEEKNFFINRGFEVVLPRLQVLAPTPLHFL